MEIFLKIMTMDKKGLLHRKTSGISIANIFEVLTNKEREYYFESNKGPKWKKEITIEEKKEAENKAWNRFSYDRKLTYCIRPEEAKNIE